MANFTELVKFELFRRTTPLFTFTVRDLITGLPFPLTADGAELRWIGELDLADADVDAQFDVLCTITDEDGGECTAKLDVDDTDFVGSIPLSLTAHLTYTDDDSEAHDFLQAEILIKPR